MKNYQNEAYTPYGGYRGASAAQPHEAPHDLPEGFPESYQPPSEGGYQQQEQFYGSQPHHGYGYQQSYFAQPEGLVSPFERTSMGMRARTAGWLSYLGGWITGLIFLLLARENRFVRFHAMQSLIFFGGISMVTTMFSHVPVLGFIGAGLGFVSFICWIFLMVAAHRGRYYKLPIVGDFADKWANKI